MKRSSVISGCLGLTLFLGCLLGYWVRPVSQMDWAKGKPFAVVVNALGEPWYDRPLVGSDFDLAFRSHLVPPNGKKDQEIIEEAVWLGVGRRVYVWTLTNKDGQRLVFSAIDFNPHTTSL